MRSPSPTVTAATILVVAAVTAAGTTFALARSDGQVASEGFAVAAEPKTTMADRDSENVARKRLNTDVTRHAADADSSPPKRLSITALDVNARVKATGVDSRGDAQIPRNGEVLGWYQFGASPGDARGRAVVIGHRDTDRAGPGALFDLDAIGAGDAITVEAGTRTLRYEVVALRSTPKQALAPALFRRSGAHQLVLITCGGAYLPEAGGYQDNLIAIADPITSNRNGRG